MPPHEFAGAGRFDGPQRRFRVLYAAPQRRTCFVETRAVFRASLEALEKLRDQPGSGEAITTVGVPADWYRQHAVICFRLRPGQWWLDLRAPTTREALRRELSPVLVSLGIHDFDLSAATGPSRTLTQAVGRWAYEQGYAGVVSTSRFDETLACWAIFEGAVFDHAGPVEIITRSDPDFIATARLFGLSV